MGGAGYSFTCQHCGATHEGLPTDRGYTLPDDVWAIPEPERASKAKWTSDLCQMDGRYFIRCVLSVPFTEQAGAFGWGLWVEVAWPVFQRYLELYEVDASTEPRHPATIANQPPEYEPMVGAAVTIQFGPSNRRPTIHFPASSDCLLATEQRQGIDSARYHEILRAVGAISN